MKRRMRPVVLLFLSVSLLIPTLASGQSSGTPDSQDELLMRFQIHPSASGSSVVWEELVVGPEGVQESNIFGMNLESREVFAVSTAIGNQGNPSISNSIVVWHDNRHNCAGCERDVWAIDLTTGLEFPIATGETDQSHPAIHNHTVAWLELDDVGLRLLTMDLHTSEVAEISSFAPGTAVYSPVLSEDLIVWAERTDDVSRLRVHHRADARTSTIAEQEASPGSYQILNNYDVDGYNIVWSSPELHYVDMRNGNVLLLSADYSRMPTIADTSVAWVRGVEAPYGPGIYGTDLNNDDIVPLVVGSSTTLEPTFAGNNLIWQSEAATSSSSIVSNVFQDLYQEGHQTLRDLPNPPAIVGDDDPGDYSLQQFTRPTYKGMHTANDVGWGSNSAATDALGAPSNPYFGSYVVLSPQLSVFDTYRPAPWGPKVADAMRTLQLTYNTRVVVRLEPLIRPTASPSPAPNADDVAQTVLTLVAPTSLGGQNYDWIKHLQIHNEPNIEWPSSCTCRWIHGGTKTRSWTSDIDPNLYIAINDYYTDVWYTINFYRTGHSNATVRTRMQNMEIWTPPLAPKYIGPADTYTRIQSLISLYGRLSYHVYPGPRFDSIPGAPSARLSNNTWDKEFSTWLKTGINAGTIRSIITEFGWNGMDGPCTSFTHNTIWPSSGSCAANDGMIHYFENDIHRFLTSTERRHAEVVAPFLIRGFSAQRDGMTSAGTVLRWLSNYQMSSP